MDKTNRTDPFQLIYTVAAVTIIVAGMKASSNILVPMLLAVFISILCIYPLVRLTRLGIPKGFSILLVIVSVLIAIMLVTLVVGNSIGQFTDSMPVYQTKLEQLLDSTSTRLEDYGIEFDISQWREYFNPGAALGFAQSILSGLQSTLTNAFLILLTVIFILFEIPANVHKEKGDDYQASNMELIVEKIQHYFGIKTLTSLATGILISIWLTIIKVDYPLLWGLLAFLFNFIPNIGSIIAAVPAILLALVMNGVGTAVLTLIGYMAVNIGIGNGLEPRVMGRGLGLRILVVFVSLVFWGYVFGPMGMLLAVPLTMTVKIMLDGYEQTRGFSRILAPEAVFPVEETD